MERPGRLLVCSVYWSAAGHQVIALQVADWFRAANPSLHIAALLPAAHVELASLVPALDEIIPSPVLAMDPIPADAFAGIPTDWDYVVTPLKVAGTTQTLEDFYELLRRHVRPDCVFGSPGADGMPARAPRPLRLQLSDDALQEAERRLGPDRPVVAILPGSGTGNGARTPSAEFWSAAVDAILGLESAPRVLLVGLTGSVTEGRTKGFGRAEIEAVKRGRDDVIDAFDLSLSTQLALAQRCAALIAPHTGFAFAVQAVGVPWIALSGAEHHEYWANGVPIVPLYPECPRYPCSGRRLPGCDEIAARDSPVGQFPCLSDAALVPQVGRIVGAVEDLMAHRLEYGPTIAAHLENLRSRGVGIRWPDAVLDPGYRF